MTLNMIAMLAKVLLVFLSFVGLCAFVRTHLKVNRFIAPYAVACSAIVVLMLSGMLRVLEPAFWVIYFAGFIGLIYTYIIRREKPEYGLIALLAAFTLFLVWRFYFCPLHLNDDISHWGLVARHLLRHDTFPNVDTKYVFFQSYPLGTATFIYYIGNAIAPTEGICLVAQELLQGILFLPVLAHINANRKQGYPIALAVFLVLFSFFRNMVNLQVDLVLSFFGIGIAASAAYYRDNLKKALPITLIGMLAVVYIKNSGLFFAFISALLLGYIARRCKKSGATVFATTLLTLLAAIAAYLLWILHIRLSYPAALDTKHAVSLTAYAAQAESKGISTILEIARIYLQELFSLTFPQASALLFMAGCIVMLIYGVKKLSIPGFPMHRLLACLGFCIGVYALWALMVFGMYIFSMPTSESLEAASFYRYNGTGMAYMMGLATILLFVVFNSEHAPLLPGLRLTQVCAIALILVFTVCSCMNMHDAPFGKRIFARHTELRSYRIGLDAARNEYNLPDGGTYLVYCQENRMKIFRKYYFAKYEFETNNIRMIAEKDSLFMAGTWDDKEFYTDLIPFIESNIDQCDAMLIMDESELFEAQLDEFLASYTGDTPIIYTYEY